MKIRYRDIIAIILIGIIVIAIVLYYFLEKDITGKLDSYYQYIDEQGNPVSDEIYSDASSFNDDGIAFVKKAYSAKGEKYNRYDYINTSFESVTPDTWDSRDQKYYSHIKGDTDFITYTTSIPSDTLKIMDSSFEEVAEVKDVLIEDEYKDINDVQEDLILVRSKNGLFGFANTDGEWVIEGQFEDADPFINGIASVKLEGHWGGIDKSGNFVIEPKYDDNFNFYGDGEIAAVEYNGSLIYIDKEGQEINDTDYSYYGGHLYFYEGLASVKDPETSLYGYIDKSGAYVIEPQYTDAFQFRNGVAAVTKNVDGKELFGFINKQGEVLIDFRFESVGDYSERYPIAVELDGRWGYIDSKGNWVVVPIYDYAESFSNGYAVVKVKK